MTEVARIMEKGFLRKDFLKEETICDFLVDEKRKKIWAIELDLLLEFDRVCKKYGLKYFLMYGSLLGAVRHKGFIPWDDDLDVGMLREDYERFIEVAKDEFIEPYFLQTPYTDIDYYFSFVKLRNSNTAAVSKAFQYQAFNQGIFLDIFPLDYSEAEEMEERYNKVKSLAIQNSTLMKLSNPNYIIDDNSKQALLKTNPIETYEEIQQLAMNHFMTPKKHLALAVWTGNHWSKYLYNASDFETIIECEFEGSRLPIPVGYKRILQTIYGDYLKLPNIELRGQWHNGAFFDPDISYKKYINGKCQ